MVESTKIKNQFYLAILFTVLVFAAIGGVVFGIYQENRELLKKRSELLKLEGDLKVLDSVFLTEKAYRPVINKALLSLPDGFDEISYSVNQIEKQATGSAQLLENSIEKEKVNDSGLTAIRITSKTGGTYANLTSFLSRLAKLPYHTRILEMNIEKTETFVGATIKYLLYIK